MIYERVRHVPSILELSTHTKEATMAAVAGSPAILTARIPTVLVSRKVGMPEIQRQTSDDYLGIRTLA